MSSIYDGFILKGRSRTIQKHEKQQRNSSLGTLKTLFLQNKSFGTKEKKWILEHWTKFFNLSYENVCGHQQLWGLVKRVEEIRLEAFLCVTILGNRMSSSVWLVRIPSFFGGPRIEKSVPHPMENYRWPCCFDHWKPRMMLLRPCSSQTKSLSHFLHHFSKLLHSVRK